MVLTKLKTGTKRKKKKTENGKWLAVATSKASANRTRCADACRFSVFVDILVEIGFFGAGEQRCLHARLRIIVATQIEHVLVFGLELPAVEIKEI